jgi:hypothetical protein
MHDFVTLEKRLKTELVKNPFFYEQFGELEIHRVIRPVLVEDAISVFELKGHRDFRHAVLLLSSNKTPDSVRRAVLRAGEAKASASAKVADHVLMPLWEGSLGSRSYAVFSYCRRLSSHRLLNRVQRSMLKSTLFDWLFDLTRESFRACVEKEAEQGFARPLQYLLATPGIDKRLYADARTALNRLANRRGNVLIDQPSKALGLSQLKERFVVIDWAGSRTEGFPIFDLVRIAQSFRLNRLELHREVRRHCEILRCELIDARSYNAAALGHILINLEHFPFSGFLPMASACVDSLDFILSDL